jgi:CRP-like cAMP-binding protein
MTNSKPVQNRLLEALPSKASKGVRAESELVELTIGEVLSKAGERIRNVYFPTDCFVSLVAEAGSAPLEVALVGNEGMVGIPLLLGADSKPLQVLVQRSGRAWRVKAESFMRMMDANLPLRHELVKYVSLRLAQVIQTAVCTGAHQLEARLARRLLMMQDRSHSNRLHATQESLASMLGVRRSGVTCAAVVMQRDKLIQYNRGVLTILDRKGLEKISCDCYRQTQSAAATKTR